LLYKKRRIVVSSSVGGVLYNMSVAGVRVVEFGTNGNCLCALTLDLCSLAAKNERRNDDER